MYLAIVDLRLDLLRQPGHARQLFHQRRHAAHVDHLFELVAHVGEIEALALHHLLGELALLLLVDARLDLLDQ